MAHKHKFSYETKEKVILEYLNHTYSNSKLCHIYGMNYSTLEDWLHCYNIFGLSGLNSTGKNKHYSNETKYSAVADCIAGEMTIAEVLEKYKIRSKTQLKHWIKKYNSHETLKSTGAGGKAVMTKGRKTTFDERVEIVQYCIEHQHNYNETAEKYQLSYQQARAYTLKYEDNGIDGLKDRRGRTKPAAEMSEVERLRAENRILKAEKRAAEMEASFLKKLEEVERGWD